MKGASHCRVLFIKARPGSNVWVSRGQFCRQAPVNPIISASWKIHMKITKPSRNIMKYHIWLVVFTILKNMKVNGKDDNPLLWKIKNVPNHQPDTVCRMSFRKGLHLSYNFQEYEIMTRCSQFTNTSAEKEGPKACWHHLVTISSGSWVASYPQRVIGCRWKQLDMSGWKVGCIFWCNANNHSSYMPNILPTREAWQWCGAHTWKAWL